MTDRQPHHPQPQISNLDGSTEGSASRLDAGSVGSLILSAARQFGDDKAIIMEERSLSFTQLAEASLSIARALRASKIGSGDRVAIWGPNSVNWAVAALGIYLSGACLVPLNSRYTGFEAADMLRRTRARLVFLSPSFLDRSYISELSAAGLDTDDLEVVSLDEAEQPGAISWTAFESRSNTVSQADVLEHAQRIKPTDISDILFTSGTTGVAKGVMLTHGATLSTYESWCDVIGLSYGDRYLVINPFFHAFGLKAGIVASLLRGVTLYPQATFDPVESMRTIQEVAINVLPGPPTIYQTLLDHEERAKYDLSSLDLAVTGAADVPVELIKRMKNELGFGRICTGYGLTEATGLVSMCRPDEDPEIVATTAGKPVPGVEVMIAGTHETDDGTFSADETAVRGTANIKVGEVLVRGENVMPAYFEDAQATAETIDDDGWLHTGDLGTFTASGHLRITGRLKEMFIVGGFNTYPAEIESVMSLHPGISQVAVIGIPDVRMGEVGAAFIVTRLGASLDSTELLAWCRERMANYKVPRVYEFRQLLPTNPSGKIIKSELVLGAS